MPPMTDPRAFAEVLADWISRHGGTPYAVSEGRILSANRQTVGKWLRGLACPFEREVRALMTMADDGAFSILPTLSVRNRTLLTMAGLTSDAAILALTREVYFGLPNAIPKGWDEIDSLQRG